MKGARNKSHVQSSIDKWESIYSQRQSILLYPNSTFITLSHHLLKPKEYPRVLDYGFGYGANMISLLKRGFEVSGVEVSRSVINLVRARLKKEHLSAELKLIKGAQLPFNDNAFDAVIAWQVLDYNTWDSLELAVKEIDRVLKVGGKFIGTFTASDDVSCQHSKKLGKGVYQIKLKKQKDLVRMAVDRKNLHQCFPSKEISIGKSGFQYNNLQFSHWIVTYEKE